MQPKTIFCLVIGCIVAILSLSLIPVAESEGVSAVDDTNISNAFSDCNLEDDYNIVLVGETIYYVPDAIYKTTYEYVCESVLHNGVDFDSTTASCFQEYKLVTISGLSEYIESTSNRVDLENISVNNLAVATESVSTMSLSSSDTGVTGVIEYDWGYTVYISGEQISDLTTVGSITATALTLIPGVGALGAVVLGVIAIALSAISLTDYVDTGIAFDVHVVSINYLFGHKIMIPHQPYVWNIRGQ
jgi:hypothetical protein